MTCTALFSRAACYTLLLLATGSTVADARPPAAPVRDVVDTYHGVAVHDPYRDLEDLKNPATQAWLKAQSEYATQTLAAIAGRDALAARIAELTQSGGDAISAMVRVRGGRVFYLKRPEGSSQFKLMVRDRLSGAERVLVDPDSIARRKGGVPHAINYMMPSWDGRLVAYGLSAAGSEDAWLHVIDTDTARERIRPVPRVQEALVHWTPDSRALTYNQLRRLPPSADPTEFYLDSTVYLQRLGEAKPQPIFGRLLRHDLGIDRLDVAGVQFQAGSRFMVARTTDTTVPEGRIFVAPLSDLGRPRARWRALVTAADQVTDLALDGDRLYLRTRKNAPRGRWLALDLARGDTLADARTAVTAPDQGVLQRLLPRPDGLLVTVSQGFSQQLMRVGADGTVAAPLTPGLSGYHEAVTDLGRADDIWLRTSEWTAPPRILRTQADGPPLDTGLLPARLPKGAPALVAREVMVPSHDGVQVPLAIVHRADLALDGQRPTLLEGYAAYGFSIEAHYGRRNLAWLEKGGVLAFVNARGSGAFGDTWHRAGFKTTKPNTWKDGIAAAKYLIGQGITRPAKLAISGGSAGGIFVGRATTEAPELFAAAVYEVGSLDNVRAEFTANGITNISEFGTVKDPAEFKALLEMSTYHQIRDGVAYPAVLLIHGLNDPRVEVWNSSKTAARLQAANPNGKPVLLRLDAQAGHGIGSTANQFDQQVADMFSFLWWQMGEVQGPVLR
ncbi:S9 family peptidase [Ideonella sp. 4Y11]|uniref:prolyl oligopeptidase n=1 Tax=Ideonella aquatica TaxID=2824119 RepID=A0A940YJF6_9BURK|nr:prolyl oligopeptidase family serine peptidase [Ideonella aquatica]MBQ0959792.1 S9 family peptidase [Ideonella aquatica]